MKLAAGEIRAGLAIHFDYPALIARSDLFLSNIFDHSGKSRPLLCVARDGDMSWWAPVTTSACSKKHQRLFLLPEWRSGGADQWTMRPCFLLDGASLMAGPSIAFCMESVELTTPQTRGMLSLEGLRAVAGEIRNQTHRRTGGLPPIPTIDFAASGALLPQGATA